MVFGQLSQMPNQFIELRGFDGFKTYSIGADTLDINGNFKISYNGSDKGIGFLAFKDKSFIVILSGENIELFGNKLEEVNSLKIKNGIENLVFEQYVSEIPRREQALNAWNYLDKLYSFDPLFKFNIETQNLITKEKNRILNEDSAFISNLSKESYVAWYLSARKLVSSVSVITKYRPEEIPATIKAFRYFDYADDRLYKSGLLKNAIEGHFWLLENAGLSLDSMYLEMSISIDAMLEKLSANEKKINEITNHLFEFLEQRSLFAASEYLALKVLNEVGCTIEPDLARQLESYRAMKKGSIVADFSFSEDTWAPGYAKAPAKLTDVPASFIAIVFGASWCPQCTEEIPTISQKYSTWKQKGVEVIFVSLDVDKNAFKTFSKDFPFISTCDYKKWDGNTVNSYYVFATPTLFLLDRNRKIMLRPNNVQQLDSWILENL